MGRFRCLHYSSEAVISRTGCRCRKVVVHLALRIVLRDGDGSRCIVAASQLSHPPAVRYCHYEGCCANDDPVCLLFGPNGRLRFRWPLTGPLHSLIFLSDANRPFNSRPSLLCVFVSPLPMSASCDIVNRTLRSSSCTLFTAFFFSSKEHSLFIWGEGKRLFWCGHLVESLLLAHELAGAAFTDAGCNLSRNCWVVQSGSI